MKNILFVVAWLLFIKTSGQNVNEEFDGKKWEAPYVLDTLKGWDVERFLIPISFDLLYPIKALKISGLLRVGPKKQPTNIGAILFYGI